MPPSQIMWCNLQFQRSGIKKKKKKKNWYKADWFCRCRFNDLTFTRINITKGWVLIQRSVKNLESYKKNIFTLWLDPTKDKHPYDFYTLTFDQTRELQHNATLFRIKTGAVKYTTCKSSPEISLKLSQQISQI